MGKRVWNAGTFEYPIPAVLVSCGTMEDSNLITVAWTGIINSDPPMCYISVRKERYSYDIIKRNKEFVINLTNQRLAKATDWCGVRSGSKYDKFKEMRLSKEEGKFVKCPLVAESPISLECKVVEQKDLGSHTMFLAKILSIDVEEKFINKNGAFDISKCELIAYANGGYFTLGKKIGSFGYSVRKKKKGNSMHVKRNSKSKK